MHRFEKEAVEILNHKVFNSPDTETAANEIFKLFSKYLPLDFIYLPTYDSIWGILRYRAFVNDEGVILTDEIVQLSEAAVNESRKIISQKVGIIGDDKITKEVLAHLSLVNPSHSIAVVVEIRPSFYGVLGLSVWGDKAYTPDHVKMIKDIYNPIAGAVRHILSQLEITRLKEHLVRVTHEIRDSLMEGRIIGSLKGLKGVVAMIKQAAPLDVPILIMGETGVGKEVFANLIHKTSKRSDGPMISINCGAIPDTLIDSEFFGHEKGAFTGADTLRQGYFEQANRGTIFLDEIGELSMPAQVKLLRVIQDMIFQRVGGKRPISVDVRVIAATNRDLKSLVANLKFRKDLWFRLNVYPIHIPPLRERILDIPALAEYFLRCKSNEMNLPYRSVFARGAMEQLQAYDWPGNVRELQNVIERALITSRGEPLSFANLVGNAGGESESSMPAEKGPYLTLDEMTTRYIQQTIIKTKGKISGEGGAANLLGVNPSTLRARMRKLGIHLKRIPGEL